MEAFILQFDLSIITSNQLQNEHCHVIRNIRAREQQADIADPSKGLQRHAKCVMLHAKITYEDSSNVHYSGVRLIGGIYHAISLLDNNKLQTAK